MANAKCMNACSTWIIKGWIMELTWKRHRQHFYSPFRFISIFSSVKCLRSHDAFAYELETINTWTCNNMCTYVFGVQQFDYNEKIKTKNWWTFFLFVCQCTIIKIAIKSPKYWYICSDCSCGWGSKWERERIDKRREKGTQQPHQSDAEI